MTRPPAEPTHGLVPRIRGLLESNRVVVLAALVAMALTAPAWFTGLHTEDWVQKALVATGTFDFPSRVNLYGHEPRAADAVARYVFERQLLGWFPWTASTRFDVSFWRPLASATHVLEYRLWPNAAWAMHLASSLWYGALATSVALLYRRLSTSPLVAGIAALLYAVDDAHGHAVGWLANRNGVMAAFFGVLSLLFLDRWRRDGSRFAALLFPAFFALALLSAEFGLSVVGYFIAYLALVDRAPWRRRLLSALPWLSVIALWAFMYRRLGHAAHGSGLYINPLDQPMAFIFEMSERATVLLAGQLAGPPSDMWGWVDVAKQGKVVLLAAVVVWFLGRLIWPLLRDDAMSRFWAAGALLSLPPACAGFPEDRLLFFVGLGAMPVITAFVTRVLSDEIARWRHPGAAHFAAFALALAHAVIAPVALPYRTLTMHRYDDEMTRDRRELFRHVTDPANQSIVLVNARDFYFAGMLPLSGVARAEPGVSRMLTLAGTLGRVEVTRLDERTLAVRPDGGFVTRVLNRIHRGRGEPFAYGQRIDLVGIEVRVSEIDPWGEPLAATFKFALPLETPNYLWVTWTGSTYERFAPPPVGETVFVGGRS